MKALRIVLAVLGGLIVLAIVAAIIFINTFDPNSLKDELTAYVQERTGRTLTIDDSIDLSLFPWFAVETGGISLSDDPDFGERDLITIDKLSARVRVWPLLKRRIEIGRVVLDGISLNLGVDADGRGNWSTLLVESPSDAQAGETGGATAPAKRAFEQLAVDGIELRNTRILWHDASGEVIYLIRDLNLKTGEISDNSPVELALAFSALDVASQASAAIELETNARVVPEPGFEQIEASIRVLDAREQERIRVSLEVGAVEFQDGLIRTRPVALTARLTHSPFGPEMMEADLSLASAELDLDTEQLTLNELSTRTGGIEASWNLRGDAVLTAPQFAGNVAIRGASLSTLLDTLGLEPPEGMGRAAGGPFSGSAAFDLGLEPLTLSLTDLNLNAADLSMSGNADLAADGALSGHFDVPSFRPTAPLREVLAAYLPDGVRIDDVSSASASASFGLTPDRERLSFDALEVLLDSARLGGNLNLADLSGKPQMSGTVNITGLDNRLLAALASNWLPDNLLAAELGQFSLASDFSYSSAARLAAFDRTKLTAWGLTGEGHISIDQSDDQLMLSGQASLAEFSPRALLTRFDLPVPQSSDPTAFSAARLAASFETNGNDGRFRDITMVLDDSRISGEFSVEDFANPSYRFVLRTDRIDADRYLPPKGAPGGGGAAPPGSDRKLGDIRIEAEPLTATVVQGTASVGDLTIGGMRFEQLSTELAVGGGRASLSSVQTKLYGGDFTGSVTVDAAADRPSVHIQGATSSLSLDPLLTAMLGDAHISGTAKLDLDLTGSGNTIGDAMKTAAGTMHMDIRNGELDGINVGQQLCKTANRLKELPPPAAAPAVTAFSVIRGSARVKDGIATTTNLESITGFLELTASGNIRLIDQWINVNSQAQLQGAFKVTGCERLNDIIKADPIPITFGLEGKLPDVQLRFTGDDAKQLLAEWARREAGQKIDEAVEDVRDRVKNSILDRLIN